MRFKIPDDLVDMAQAVSGECGGVAISHYDTKYLQELSQQYPDGKWAIIPGNHNYHWLVVSDQLEVSPAGAVLCQILTSLPKYKFDL